MKATHHDHKTLHITPDTVLEEVAAELMRDEHTVALVQHFTKKNPGGIVSRNRRRAAFNAENN